MISLASRSNSLPQTCMSQMSILYHWQFLNSSTCTLGAVVGNIKDKILMEATEEQSKITANLLH